MIITESQAMAMFKISRAHLDKLVEDGLPTTRLFVDSEIKAMLTEPDQKEALLHLGEFKNVHMLPSELCKLDAKYGEAATADMIEETSRWFEAKPKDFRANAYLTILNMARRHRVPERDPLEKQRREALAHDDRAPKDADPVSKAKFDNLLKNLTFGGDIDG